MEGMDPVAVNRSVELCSVKLGDGRMLMLRLSEVLAVYKTNSAVRIVLRGNEDGINIRCKGDEADQIYQAIWSAVG